MLPFHLTGISMAKNISRVVVAQWIQLSLSACLNCFFGSKATANYWQAHG